MAEHRIGYLPRRWLLLAVFVCSIVAVACSGGGGDNLTPEPTATMTPKIDVPLPVAATPTVTLTALPSPTSTVVAPVALPTPLPSPTQLLSLAPQVSCPERTHHHLNIELLTAQPGMEGAVIMEIDDRSIRIELEGSEFLIEGWLKVVGIGEPPDVNESLSRRVGGAVDAVRYEC